MIILHVANFFHLKFKGPHALTNTSRRISLGLARLGHHVIECSDRDVIRYQSWGLFKRWGYHQWQKQLLERMQMVQPDQLWLGMGDSVAVETLKTIKQRYPSLVIVLYNGDQRGKPFAHIVEKLPSLDWLFMTSGGENLRQYVALGGKNVAFMPNMTDPALDYAPDEDNDPWRSEVIFPGGLHGDPIREQVIGYLLQHQAPLTLYRAKGRPTVSGRDYFRAISQSKIGLNISAFLQFPKYLSDRPFHYLGVGTFTLTYHVPQLEKLFKPDDELVSFTGGEACLEKINYYLTHDEARKKIAKAGQRAVRQRFTPEKVVQDMLLTIDDHASDHPWSECYHGS
ncbi:glycosyltransferase family protein [Magnetococcales bacterium HHB-1]